MKKMFLLFSHNLSDEQIADAESNLGCNEFIRLPKNLQDIWSNVFPDIDTYERLEKIKDFILGNYSEGDYALIQGEWGYTFEMVLFCKNIGIIPVYSTTFRDSQQVQLEDGKVYKTSLFRHIRYKKY